MTPDRRRARGALLIPLALATSTLLACTSASPLADRGPATPASRAQGEARLSLLDVMRALIEPSASAIGTAQFAERLSDAEWRLVDQDAVNLAAGAALMAVPGAGPKDAEWVAHRDWQAWRVELQGTAVDLREAARMHDLARLGAAGDRLQQVCVACHTRYRPAVPTDGVVRYPFYPSRELPQ